MDLVEYEKMYRLEEEFWWYRALRDRIDIALEAYAPRFGSLLDAGCGTGGVLRHVRERYPKAHAFGFDFSSEALKRCRARGLPCLAQGSINDVPFSSDCFDVVTSNDVLYFEGIEDERALVELARVLAPDGVLILNLPAFEFLRGAHDEFVKTRRRYTRADVRGLMRKAQLEMVTATYWNAPLLPAVALVRWLRNSREGVPESDLRALPPWLNRMLYGLLRIEAAWLRFRTVPLGTSVFCVARKSSHIGSRVDEGRVRETPVTARICS